MAKVAKRVDSERPRQMGSDEDWFGFLPFSAVMVTCQSVDGRANIIPLIAWSFICRWPPLVTIGICEVDYTPRYFQRASYRMILETGEFALNIPDESLRDAMMTAGSLSANDPDLDKFAASGLTPSAGLVIDAPLIAECPINVECVVREHTSLGSHHLFIGEIVAYHQCGDIVEHRVADGAETIVYQPLDGGCTRRLVWRNLIRMEETE